MVLRECHCLFSVILCVGVVCSSTSYVALKPSSAFAALHNIVLVLDCFLQYNQNNPTGSWRKRVINGN